VTAAAPVSEVESRLVTDPKTRSPEFWRGFAWLSVATTIIVVAAGTGSAMLGSPVGWVVVALAAIPAFQATQFFRRYRQGKRHRDGE
jgi:hypothetical protein